MIAQPQPHSTAPISNAPLAREHSDAFWVVLWLVLLLLGAALLNIRAIAEATGL